MKQPKKSGGGRPLLWILLLVLIGGIGYIAMEPEQLTEWLAPLLGENAPKQPVPPVAMQPKPPMNQPAAPPPPPPMTTPGEMTAAPPPAASAPPPPPPVATAPDLSAPMTAAPAPPAPAKAMASPLFGEGQRVTVMGNPTNPGELVPLTLDATGAKPGPSIRPGATLSILDGDLQPGGWVYSVRTDDGVKGWVSEKRLRMKF